MAKKKMSSSLVVSSEFGAAALGSSISRTFNSSLASFPVCSPMVASGFSSPLNSMVVASSPVNSVVVASGSAPPGQSCLAASSGSPRGSGSSSVEISPSIPQSTSRLATEVQRSGDVDGIALFETKPAETEVPPVKNYAALLKSSAQLQELGTPVEHISGAPFVLVPDENIEAAKLEFKDFIYARFHGDCPSMGKIIGVVNAVWAKTGPRIFVHNIGHSTFLLRVTTPRTREVLLSRTCWNIGGLPMFVAPWSQDYSPDEPPLTSAIVPVEMRNIPYLLFNQEILSRLATAIGKPDSLALETERKENFELAKLYVRVDLTTPLPSKIVSGFSNGKEVEIAVTYPWLPVKCDLCEKFGHPSVRCDAVAPERASGKMGARKNSVETFRRRSQSKPGRSTDKKVNQGTLRYIPVVKDSVEASKEADSSLPHENGGLVASTTQDDQNGDLEDGEIPQQHMEKATVEFSHIDALSNGISTGAFDVLARISPDACGDDLLFVSVDETKLEEDRTDRTSSVTFLDDSGAVVKVAHAESSPEVAADTTLGTDSTGCEGSAEQKPLLDLGLDRERIIYPAEEQDRDNPFFWLKTGRVATRGWKFFGNYLDDDSGRIIIVWDPKVTMVIYDTTPQSVTCGVTILSENVTLTVTFVYGFNLVDDRKSLWDHLANLQATAPVSAYRDDANIGLQDTQLFEAQAKGLPFTWRNSQDDNPISTKIDHAFINQPWSTAFPDSYADFLDPSQSDHTPCLFRMPSIRRQIIKPFKLFHHVIDHPEYAEKVTEAWNWDQITGTDQFKLVRSLKLLKRPLRQLNKNHFSSIMQRVKEQKEKVNTLQRLFLTALITSTAREEHIEREKLNVLLRAEEKFYKQKSRVRWSAVGDRNTTFYHRTVSSHASRNHIHYLKDADDHTFFTMEDIKAHAADSSQGILGCTDPPSLPTTAEELHKLFSSRVTWERIRKPSPPVHWHSTVWFKEEIPRCSFITWTAFLGRLPTRDRLISWGLVVQPGWVHGVFSSIVPGSHQTVPIAPTIPNTARCSGLEASKPSHHLYNLWHERNVCIFKGEALTQEAFYRVVDRRMRDRLLSLSHPSNAAPSPSLLELYFCFISPYS
uniref:DUF4283 domain-containing protein n=1 Tax=Brassica campestris TaxID=3711 RepID=M4F9W8_BRACM